MPLFTDLIRAHSAPTAAVHDGNSDDGTLNISAKAASEDASPLAEAIQSLLVSEVLKGAADSGSTTSGNGTGNTPAIQVLLQQALATKPRLQPLVQRSATNGSERANDSNAQTFGVSLSTTDGNIRAAAEQRLRFSTRF